MLVHILFSATVPEFNLANIITFVSGNGLTTGINLLFIVAKKIIA